jgi:hypothetical protein
MAFPLDYHMFMRRSIASSTLFVALALLFSPAILSSTGKAQTNGVPASVTSPGFGGRAINGPPPSVTSVGPRGFGPRVGSVSGGFPRRDHDRDNFRHHHSHNFAPVYGGVYAVPYAVPDSTESAYDDEDDYQGGPTIFDRRGSGAQSYVPPMQNPPAAHSPEDFASTTSSPEPPQAPTVLVFKDGHQLEVGNYAIVGQTIYDLTPGHPRKIALADLDLDATAKHNEDRGVIFQLPANGQAN